VLIYRFIPGKGVSLQLHFYAKIDPYKLNVYTDLFLNKIFIINKTINRN